LGATLEFTCIQRKTKTTSNQRFLWTFKQKEEEKEVEGGEKTLHLEEGGNNLPTLKVSTQCPLVLLVEVRLREGKVLGREEGKALGSGLFIYVTFKIQFVPHRKHITSPLRSPTG
jgi:hypothetical protein